MLESYTEGEFVRRIKKVGGMLIKLSPRGIKGIPDRMAVGPYKTIFFIEFKKVGKAPTKLQEYRHETLRELGFEVFVIYRWQDALAIYTDQVRKNKILQLSKKSNKATTQ